MTNPTSSPQSPTQQILNFFFTPTHLEFEEQASFASDSDLKMGGNLGSMHSPTSIV